MDVKLTKEMIAQGEEEGFQAPWELLSFIVTLDIFIRGWYL